MRYLAILAAIIILAALVLRFGPRATVDFSELQTPVVGGINNLDEYLAQSEAQFPDIKPNQAKKIIWADDVKKTPIAIVYVHGFSASSGEIRPVPDNLARELGANLYYARLTGHARPGDAMGEVHVNDWLNDMNEALAIGHEIGDRVVVIGTSTGATLITSFLDRPQTQDVAGIIFVSPNFNVHSKQAWMAKLAFFDKWAPWIAGKTRGWEPRNETQAKFWTTSYPLGSIVPMMHLIDYVEHKIDVSKTKIPALFYYSKTDRVVDASRTDALVADWGGAVSVYHPTIDDQVDVFEHVITGDAMSPSQTGIATETMLAFIRKL